MATESMAIDDQRGPAHRRARQRTRAPGPGPCTTRIAWRLGGGRSPSGRRWELLPFVLIEVLAAAPFEERHDSSDDGSEERHPNQLSEEPTLLLLLGALSVPGHGPLLPIAVGLDGLEPSTSSLSGMRSNRAELKAR